MTGKKPAVGAAGDKRDRGNLRLVVSASVPCPEGQSNAQWLDNYDSAAGITAPRRRISSEPSLQTPPRAQTLTGGFRYIDHRTTRQGRLILEFEHVDTGQLALYWFNIQLRKYRSGRHGQFGSLPRSKFRRFYSYIFGDPKKSFRWSRVHYKLGHMRTLEFSGTAVCHARGYFEITKIALHKQCTKTARAAHKDCT